MKLTCTKCGYTIPSIQELATHKCPTDDLDEQIQKANARDFEAAPSREDRYATTTKEKLYATYDKTCPVCGRPTSGTTCTYCIPDDNDFRPTRNLPPKREWLQQTGGLRVFKMTPEELQGYLATGEFPAYPTK